MEEKTYVNESCNVVPIKSDKLSVAKKGMKTIAKNMYVHVYVVMPVQLDI